MKMFSKTIGTLVILIGGAVIIIFIFSLIFFSITQRAHDTVLAEMPICNNAYLLRSVVNFTGGEGPTFVELYLTNQNDGTSIILSADLVGASRYTDPLLISPTVPTVIIQGSSATEEGDKTPLLDVIVNPTTTTRTAFDKAGECLQKDKEVVNRVIQETLHTSTVFNIRLSYISYEDAGLIKSFND